MRALLVVAVMVAGCGLPGAPVIGSACSDEKPECFGSSSIALCNVSKWEEYPCEGRCSNEQATRCTLAKPVVGSVCPVPWVGSGMCSKNPNVFARCVGETGTVPKWVGCDCSDCDGSSGFLQCSAPSTCRP